MIITESELRDQLRRPTTGASVTIPAGARFSPSAADFVKQWGLVVEEAPVQQQGAPRDDGRGWDRAAQFPVDLAGERPRCLVCGGLVEHKPPGLTQLDAHHYAPKTHPRIKLRGQVDQLHALTMLIQRMAREAGMDGLARDLGTIAAYCRELTSAEYNERPVAEFALREDDAERIHAATHDPRGALGIDHLTIDDGDDRIQHWLNLGRATARQVEIAALEAFPSPHHPYGAGICQALNRLSSVFYYLQLRLKAGR